MSNHKLTIKADALKLYQDKYPLILKETLISWDSVKQEGDIIELYSLQKKFIAKAYHGIQNKGYGWILTYDKNEKIDQNFFEKKIKEAIDYRKNFFENKATTAFRIFNGEGDGIGGLTIDYFDDFYLFTWYSLGIYHFKEIILNAFRSSVSYKGIYQKKRFNTKGGYLSDEDDFIDGQKANFPIIIKENNIRFAIYLDDGAMVGIFLDQREVRNTLRQHYSKNKNILNTFSYTGAFSVASALGGAKKTSSVDLAKRSLVKTREQFVINNINLDKQNIIIEDVFNYFKYAIRKKLLFDVVIVDPPSFARSKKITFSVAKDYTKLLKEVIQITNKGGIIVASTNYANLDASQFRYFIYKAFDQLKCKYKIEKMYSLPPDFRVSSTFLEGDYLKVAFIRKIK